MNKSKFLIVSLTGIIFYLLYKINGEQKTSQYSPSNSVIPKSISKAVDIPQLKTRAELGSLMEELGGKSMIEIGVQKGHFARDVLARWNNFEKYYGIDPWEHQEENYINVVNVKNADHNKFYLQTKQNLAKYGDRIELIKGFSNNEAYRFANESIDFIYVDGRHDYCGCYEDLELFWPKLTKGGIMAGHDYFQPKFYKFYDWRLCANGTRIEGTVIAAFTDFRQKHGITKYWVITEKKGNPSIYFQKPLN